MDTLTAKGKTARASTRRKNMKGPEREQIILEAAIRFFAENGFEAQTRELARRANTTHSALFRHFPTKDTLIESVYERVFVSRWDPSWEAVLADPQLGLEEKLATFYVSYAERIFDYDWVRIFIHSGLRSHSMMPRYLALIEERVIVPICRELRRAKRQSPSEIEAPVSEREREAVWGLHGQIFYIAVRTYIYGMRPPADRNEIIADHVRRFVRGELSAG